MAAFAGIMLLVNAFYNIIVWPRFWTRVAKDERARTPEGRPTKFLIVHAILIILALVIAVVSAVAGIMLLVA
ncbi:MAG: hypothetical protein WDA07_04730 [Leucobacter sp.]